MCIEINNYVAVITAVAHLITVSEGVSRV